MSKRKSSNDKSIDEYAVENDADDGSDDEETVEDGDVIWLKKNVPSRLSYPTHLICRERQEDLLKNISEKW
jgi:hypothetical protein